MSDALDTVEKNSGELNTKGSVGAKILMFLSGVALIALILFLFTGGIALVTLVILGVILSVIWGCAVFIWNVPLRFNRVTSSLCNRISAISAIIVDILVVFFSGFALVGYTAGISARTITTLFSRLPLSNVLGSLWDNHVLCIWLGVIVLGILSFFVLCVVLHAAVGTRLRDAYLKDGKKTIILFAAASALWVFVPLLPLYLTNINNVTVLFVLLLALIYILGTLLVYFIFLLIFKSAFVSFCVCVIFWIGLSISEGLIHGLLTGIPHCTLIFCFVLLSIMVLAGFGICKLVKGLHLPTDKILKWVIVLVLVLLVINLVPIVIQSVEISTQSSDVLSDELVFDVDTSLPHPNVYWIHGESMIDNSVLEKYWSADSVGFEDILTEKGFVFNHDAYITGKLSGYTTYALSSLFAPGFYDKVTAGELNVEHSVAQNVLEDGHELISAFDAAGYNSVGIMGAGDLYYVRTPAQTINYYSNSRITTSHTLKETSELDFVIYFNLDQEFGFVEYSAFPVSVLFNLMNLKNKLINLYEMGHFESISLMYVSDEKKNSIMSGTDWLNIRGYDGFVNAFEYSLDTSNSPSLTLLFSSLAHAGYTTDEYGNSISSTVDIAYYYGQYLFSERLILYYVDEILKHDSDAIVIIQGDHGPHSGNFEGYEAFFEKDPRYKEYKCHVLSAIRIPPQYQTEGYEEIMKNPRNIVRYLINTYVGQNYEYLPTENYA